MKPEDLRSKETRKEEFSTDLLLTRREVILLLLSFFWSGVKKSYSEGLSLNCSMPKSEKPEKKKREDIFDEIESQLKFGFFAEQKTMPTVYLNKERIETIIEEHGVKELYLVFSLFIDDTLLYQKTFSLADNNVPNLITVAFQGRFNQYSIMITDCHHNFLDYRKPTNDNEKTVTLNSNEDNFEGAMNIQELRKSIYQSILDISNSNGFFESKVSGAVKFDDKLFLNQIILRTWNDKEVFVKVVIIADEKESPVIKATQYFSRDNEKGEKQLVKGTFVMLSLENYKEELKHFLNEIVKFGSDTSAEAVFESLKERK